MHEVKLYQSLLYFHFLSWLLHLIVLFTMSLLHNVYYITGNLHLLLWTLIIPLCTHVGHAHLAPSKIDCFSTYKQ